MAHLRRWLRYGLVIALAVAVVATAEWLGQPRMGDARWDFAAACSVGRPHFVAACYRGLARDRSSRVYDLDAPSVVMFSNTPADRPHYSLATFQDVGTVWGLAYSQREQAVYAAAFYKRQLPFGPGGPGAIYRIDVLTLESKLFATIPDVGPDRHGAERGAETSEGAWAGKSGLGDIDLSDDEGMLFVTNLTDRRVYRVELPSGQIVGSFGHGALAEPWAADEARPFALAVDGNFVYHGLVRSAEKSLKASDLEARVYRSRHDGAAMTLVATVDLDFPRGRVKPVNDGLHVKVDWRPWRDGYAGYSGGTNPPIRLYPMPLLTDIEIGATGEMNLGLRDRRSDEAAIFAQIYGQIPNRGQIYLGFGVGDIMRGLPIGDGWQFDTTTEWFRDGSSIYGDETSLGGLAMPLDGAEVIVGSNGASTGGRRLASAEGAIWYDAASGAKRSTELLCSPASLVNPPSPRAGAVAHAHDGEPPPPPTATPPPGIATRATSPPSLKLEYRAPGTVGDIEILCRPAIPTSTPTPTATVTASATPTATPTATSTSTATASPVPGPAYLPIAIKEANCRPGFVRTDVALVLDASTSMADATAGGRSKLEAAQAAALRFLEHMNFDEGDQAAIVTFNSDGTVLEPLGGDRSALVRAVGDIEMAPQTRIQLGIELATQELTGPARNPLGLQAMIVLTDGRNNPEPVAVALEVAEAAKGHGIRLFAIGLGHDIEADALAAMASNPGDFFLAPDGEDLLRIYEHIALAIPCPPREYWPAGRP